MTVPHLASPSAKSAHESMELANRRQVIESYESTCAVLENNVDGMEKTDVPWREKIGGIVHRLSFRKAVRGLAVDEDPNHVATRRCASPGRISNESQPFYLAGPSTTSHGVSSSAFRCRNVFRAS